MKKTILVIILVAVMLLAAVSTVNAASVTQSTTQVKEGETVTITVKPTKANNSIQFDIKFDNDKFEYIQAQAGSLTIGEDKAGANQNGTATVMAYGASDKSAEGITVTFKAKKAADASSIVITNFISGSERVENVGTVNFEIRADQEPEQPGNTEKPEDTQKPEETEKPTQTQKPSKLPQTGTPTYIVAVAVIVIAAGVIFAIRKNK